MHYMIKVSRANESYALITGDEPLYDVVKVLSDIRIGFSEGGCVHVLKSWLGDLHDVSLRQRSLKLG